MAMDPVRRRPYYFNGVSHEVVWQRPDALKGASLSISAAAPPPPPFAPTAASPTLEAQRAEWTALEREWEPAVDASSGRTYYINKRLNQSSWERPTYDPAIQARQEERLEKHRQAGADKAAAEEAASKVDGEVEERVRRWARHKSTLGALLATLGEIWPGASADDFPPELHKCEPSALRRAYLKSVRLTHPDKQAAGVDVRQRVLAQKLFALLASSNAKWQKAQK